jgi:hypothetical protein
MPQVSARHCSPFEWKCRALLQQAWPSLQHSIALACEAMATSGTCPASIKSRPASAVIIRTTARRLFGANSIHLILAPVPENKSQSESKAERSMDTAKLSEALTELALDLRWAWNHSADELWGELDPERWELTGNAWAVLQSVSRAKLQTLASNPDFQRKVERLVQEKRDRAAAPRWFQQAKPDSRLTAGSLLQSRIHAERCPADLLGRPRQRGRRPAQIGERSRHSGHRRRPSLSVWLLPPAHRRTGQTARTLSLQRPRATARHASARPGRRMVIRAAGLPRLQTTRSYLAGRSGRHKTLPARYQ